MSSYRRRSVRRNKSQSKSKKKLRLYKYGRNKKEKQNSAVFVDSCALTVSSPRQSPKKFKSIDELNAHLKELGVREAASACYTPKMKDCAPCSETVNHDIDREKQRAFMSGMSMAWAAGRNQSRRRSSPRSRRAFPVPMGGDGGRRDGDDTIEERIRDERRRMEEEIRKTNEELNVARNKIREDEEKRRVAKRLAQEAITEVKKRDHYSR